METVFDALKAMGKATSVELAARLDIGTSGEYLAGTGEHDGARVDILLRRLQRLSQAWHLKSLAPRLSPP